MQEITPHEEALFQIAEAIKQLADVHQDFARSIDRIAEVLERVYPEKRKAKV